VARGPWPVLPSPRMATRLRGAGVTFLVLGIVFIAIGASGQRAFTTIGLVFLVLGIVRLARSGRGLP
jgi:hypothetical protein